MCAQNLVPNFSFEDTVGCSYDAGDIDSANFWFEPYPCSADYFNSCNNSSTNIVGTPCHIFLGGGCQNPKTGNAYAGFSVYSTSTEYREYIEAKLISPLIANKKYCVEFYVTLIENAKYATDAIHGLLTVDSIITLSPNCFHLTYNPQIKNTAANFITDTLNWSSVYGEYIAQGGEKFLTIGNFYDDNNTSFIIVNNSSSYSTAYYFIDDVSVTLCDTTAVEELQITD